MPQQFTSIAAGGELVIQINELHRRLGHLGIEACRDAVRRGMVDGIKLVDANAPAIICEPCAWSKAAEKLFPKESTTPRATEYGGRCHGSGRDACPQGRPGVARPSDTSAENIGGKECRESRRKNVDRSDGSGREYWRIGRTHQIMCRLEISVLIAGLDMIG